MMSVQITKYFIAACLALMLSSCIDLYNEYPEITYYRFDRTTKPKINPSTVNGTLQIRDFKTAEELDTDHLMAEWEDNRVQVYYYHRWLTDCSVMASDFIINRFNMMNAFTGGVIRPASVRVPDYILSGQILDMMAHNSEEDDPGANYVFLSIQVNLYKNGATEDNDILMTKIYTRRVERQNNRVRNIAPALSVCLSEIADEMLADVQEAATLNILKPN